MLRTLRECKKRVTTDAAPSLTLIEKSVNPEAALIIAAINICKQVDAELVEGAMFPDGSLAIYSPKVAE